MNHLEPRTSHPLLWVLEQLLGLDLADVAEATGMSRSTLRHIREGKPPKRAQVLLLAKLVRDTADALSREMSPRPRFSREILPAPFKYWHRSDDIFDWRKRTFQLINQLIAHHTNPAVAEPRQTTLGYELIVVVGKGKEEDLVFASFRSTQRRHLRKVAARVGIRVTTTTDGRRFWKPPADLPSVAPRAPDVPVHLRTTPRAMRLQNALQSFLWDRHAKGAESHLAIDYVRKKTGCSRPAVFRAARDLGVVREVTGFGSSKSSVWRLPPHLGPQPKPDDGEDEEV